MASETLAVTIPAELVAALRDAVGSGEYPDTDAALADALTTWARRHQDREESQAWLRAKVQSALHDPRASLNLKDVDAHMEAFFRNVERARNDEAA